MILITGINPEPWAVGTVGSGRRGGKIRGQLSPNVKLQVYQAALRDELESRDLEGFPTGDVMLRFMFWRQIEIGNTPGGKQTIGHVADTTNLQKATEDVLQGILLTNDRQVRDVHSTIIDQTVNTVPGIIINIYRWTPGPYYEMVTEQVLEQTRQQEKKDDNAWG